MGALFIARWEIEQGTLTTPITMGLVLLELDLWPQIVPQARERL